jgi:hypothetical protein
MVMEGTPPAPRKVRRLGTQRLFHPRSLVIEMGPTMMPVMAPGRIGAGYDVLESKRGDARYSPLCAVFTYDAGMPLRPEELPKDAATIEAMFNTQAAPLRPGTPPLVYCLQVRAP